MSTSRAHANRDDINTNGIDKTLPCVRCLKAIATSDPLELKCRVMDAYDGARKCGRCVGMGKACFEVHADLVNQANELLAEYQRVVALPSRPSRVPEVAKVKKMAERFKHREESHGREARRRTLSGGVVGGSVPGVAPAGSGGGSGGTGSGGENVREKLDKIIKGNKKIIANGEETNRLLRSLERMGEKALEQLGVGGGTRLDEDPDYVDKDEGMGD